MERVKLELLVDEVEDLAHAWQAKYGGAKPPGDDRQRLALAGSWLALHEALTRGGRDTYFLEPVPVWLYVIIGKALLGAAEVVALRKKVDLLTKQLKEARKPVPKPRAGKARRSTSGSARPAPIGTTGSAHPHTAPAAAAAAGS